MARLGILHPLSAFLNLGPANRTGGLLRGPVLIVALVSLGTRLLAQSPDTTVAVTQATAAAAAWLQLLDSSNYGAGWDSAAPELRRAVAREAWVQTLTNARHSLEPLAQRRLLSTRPSPGPAVVIEYEAMARTAVWVIERVVPTRDTSGTWRDAGYFIRPAPQ